MLHELTRNQKNHHFEVSFPLILRNTTNHFSIGLWCQWKVDFIQQLVMTSSVTEAQKHFPKPNLSQKKGYGLCLGVCCLSDPLQFSESWQNHYIWEVYSPKTAIPQPASVNKKSPILLHKPDRMSDNHCFKSWNKLGYKVLLYPPYLSDFSPTNYHFFRHLNNFLQEKCFHNQ